MKTPPSLTDAFNSCQASMISPTVLQVSSGYHHYYYDFAQRIMTAAIHHGGGSTPFAQLDREVLTAARDRLIGLGGNPPELADSDPGLPPAPARKLNL
jgi:hypothetical protein